MDDFEKHEVLLAFKHRGQSVQLPASAKGWAQAWLKENPWNYNRRSTRQEYEQQALRQGHIAVNSVLRDQMKGQVTAIERACAGYAGEGFTGPTARSDWVARCLAST